jgi:hypothetical protein
MRNTMNRSRISTVMTLTLGVLMLTLTAPAFAAAPLTLAGTSMSGTTVDVTVRNTSLLPQTATVSVQAIVGDTAVWSTSIVVLLPLQTRVVSVGFNGTVSSVVRVGLTMGMSDDPTPF